MKKYTLAIIALLFTLTCFGKDHSVENMEEFKSEFKGLIEIQDKTLYLQRVIPFDGESKESLYNDIKNYINSRVERKSNGKSSNSDVIYDNDAIIVTECSPSLFLGKIGITKFYGRVYYVYRFEVKEGKIRLTIYINSYDYGNFTLTVDEFYPFVKERNKHFVKTAKALFHAFVDYVNSTFSTFPEDLRNIRKQRVLDDW